MPTLEELEQDVWPEHWWRSYLVTTCHRLRRKPIEDFTIEDLRIMIGQNIGLLYLLPKAIEALKKDPLASGDFYEGDLLKSTISCEREFLTSHPEFTKDLVEICRTAISRMSGYYEKGEELGDQLLLEYSEFIRRYA